MNIGNLKLKGIEIDKLAIDRETALVLLINLLEIAERLDEQATKTGHGYCNGLYAGNIKCCQFCELCSTRELLYLSLRNPRGGMADAVDLKSADLNGRTGSTPVGGSI